MIDEGRIDNVIQNSGSGVREVASERKKRRRGSQ
jgi:hypothetical protein